MNKQFGLQLEDIEYLEANYSGQWSLTDPHTGGDLVGLVIENFRLPDGYTTSTADLMIIVPNGYPGSMLDMFYFDPPLQRIHGQAIHALASEFHFGRQWQRWSRHYQWQPGYDSLVTHIERAKNLLSVEART